MALSVHQLQLVGALVESLKQLENNPAADSSSLIQLNPDAVQVVVNAAFSWPVSQKFPALDILRMCVLYSSTSLLNNSTNTSFFSSLIEIARGSGDAKFDEVNRMFVYRILSNMVSTEAGKGMLVSSRSLILQGLTGFWKNSGNVNLRVAFVTMMLK